VTAVKTKMKVLKFALACGVFEQALVWVATVLKKYSRVRGIVSQVHSHFLTGKDLALRALIPV